MNKETDRIINVLLSGKKYPIVVNKKSNDEEYYRKAVKLLNSTYERYKFIYKDRDDFDYLAMASIDIIKKYADHHTELLPEDFIKELTIIDKELDKYLAGE